MTEYSTVHRVLSESRHTNAKTKAGTEEIIRARFRNGLKQDDDFVVVGSELNCYSCCLNLISSLNSLSSMTDSFDFVVDEKVAACDNIRIL